jgi:hypothetical protein
MEFWGIIKQNPPAFLIMDACNSLGDPKDFDLATPLLIDSGAVFAIGTSSIVRDDLAAEVFPAFYEGLILGRTFGEAFNDAEREHRGGLVQYLFLGDPSAKLH